MNNCSEDDDDFQNMHNAHVALVQQLCIVQLQQKQCTQQELCTQDNYTLSITCNYTMHMYILHNQGPRIRWKKNFQTWILKIVIFYSDEFAI